MNKKGLRRLGAGFMILVGAVFGFAT